MLIELLQSLLKPSNFIHFLFSGVMAVVLTIATYMYAGPLTVQIMIVELVFLTAIFMALLYLARNAGTKSPSKKNQR